MPSTHEKSELIIESLTKTIDKHMNDLKKIHTKKLKSTKDAEDFKIFYDNFLNEAAEKTHEAMTAWENTSLTELQDLTPSQYFDSLESLDDILELLTLIEENENLMIPANLGERIKKLHDSITDELITKLQSIQLDESKNFTPSQKAIIRIVGIAGSTKYLPVLEGFICQLDEEKSDEDTYKLLMDAVKLMGEQALESLMQLAVNNTQNKKLYISLLITIADIASKSRPEQVYKFLKDRFRKSEEKLPETAALSVFGDGRAIPAMRGYVEQNLESLSYNSYMYIRHSIIELGGDTSDLDGYFMDYEGLDEE